MLFRSVNAAFLLTLRDSGVPFVAADMPETNTLTIGILAVVAQAEREAISARTKAALSARLRRRGALDSAIPWARNSLQCWTPKLRVWSCGLLD